MMIQPFDQTDPENHGLRPSMLFGYVALGLCVGATLWGAIFSVSMIKYGIEPTDVASVALGLDPELDDPMILAREAELGFIEPAAGPDQACE